MTKPVAVASATPTTFAGGSLPQLVQLDGVSSFDVDGYAITGYSWQLLYAPPGSAAVLSDSTIVNPTFTADVVGSYLFFLVVTSADPSDNESETVMRSAPDSAVLEVTAETVNFDWHIPASGARNYANHFYEILTEIDAALTPISNAHTRTDSLSATISFADSRVSGAPFATSDHLLSISNKNATGHTGENERGGIQLDMEQADVAGEASFAVEQIDGDGLAVLRGGPWRGLHMLSPVPTGTEVPTLLQGGKAGTEISNLQLLRAYWNKLNDVTLWFLEQDDGHRMVGEVTELTDVDAAVTTRYLRLYPDHATPASIEDQRLQLERIRLQIRREILVETKAVADDDYNENWRVRIWQIGRASGDQPEFGWDESEKTWYVKGINNFDSLIHGTGTVERTRVEYGNATMMNLTGSTLTSMSLDITLDRAFADDTYQVIASLHGSDLLTQSKTLRVTGNPSDSSEIRLNLDMTGGDTLANGGYVIISWMAIGNDTE